MRSQRTGRLLSLPLSLLLLLAFHSAWADERPAGPRFEISFPASAHAEPITGRLFLMISRTNQPEVRLQGTWFVSPEIVGIDVKHLVPGQAAVVDAAAVGTPVGTLQNVPAGDYYIQAVLSVYTEFHRADRHVVWAHMDQWEGQQFNKSPGNLYSPVQKLHLDASSHYSLTLSQTIPPLSPPADTEWVKYIRIQSKRLTQFWGKPIYLGAIVLLPRDYTSNPQIRYPVIYYQRGHFSLAAPFDFSTRDTPESEPDRRERESSGYETGYEFYQSWRSDHFPRMIAVSFLDPTPFGDWSGGINSANNGPYGDALTTELIPYIEKQFRILSAAYARVLTGKASGGREALALQLMHPDSFGGAWIFHPWAFDFKHYFSLDIYANDNAFEIKEADFPSWARNPSWESSLERPMLRFVDGTPFASFRQLSQHDAVMASTAGGDCIGVDDSIQGPVGEEGYPKPLWDRTTGKIDHDVAMYWRDHGDLAWYARENWPRIGPRLIGKLHLYAGERDHFFRNAGVHDFADFLESTRSPHYRGSVEYGPLAGDFQPMNNAGLVRIIADDIRRNAPEGAPSSWE